MLRWGKTDPRYLFAKVDLIAVLTQFGSADEKFLRTIANSDRSAILISQSDLAATFENIAQVLVETEGGLGLSLRRR